MNIRCAGSTLIAAVVAVGLAGLATVVANRSFAQSPATCGPSPVGATCGGAGPASLGNTSGTDQGAGNPINLITGNKYQRETDMAPLPGELGLEVVRHYNSLDRAPGSVGIGWRLSYDTEVVAVRDTIQVVEADGGRIVFTRDPSHRSLCVTQDPANGSMQVLSRRGTIAGYLWKWPSGRQLRFNQAGKLESVDDGHGKLLTLSRDTTGELLSVTDPFGRLLRLEYGTLGHDSLRVVTAIESPLGRISYSYSTDQSNPTFGNLVNVVLSDRRTLRDYHYEKEYQNGNPHALTGISVRFANEKGGTQRLSTYAYGPNGRAIWSMRGAGLDMIAVAQGPAGTVLINSQGERTHYKFGIVGGEHRLLDARGPGCPRCSEVNVRHTYDPLGRLESTEHLTASGTSSGRTLYFRDYAGRVERVRTPSVIAGRYHDIDLHYDDASSRPDKPSVRIEKGFSEFGPIERRTELAYDKLGRVEREGSLRYVYDRQGRVLEKWGSGRVTRYHYDALSRPKKVLQGDGTRIGYEYDRRGRLESISINGRTERYSYDAAERLSRVLRPNGESLNYRYDAADRVVSVRDDSGNVVAFDRNTEGSLIGRRFLDPYGNVAQRRVDTVDNMSTFANQISLDSAGHAVGYVDPRGVHGGYVYDDFGRLTSSFTEDGGVTRTEYDDQDRPILQRLSNGVAVSFRYDDAGRVIERSTPAASTFIQYGQNSRPSVVRYPGGEERYTYDSDLRLLERISRIGNAEFAVRYSYDAIGALIGKELPGGQRLEFEYRRPPERNSGLLNTITLVDGHRKVRLVSGLNDDNQRITRRGFDLLGIVHYEKELDVEGRVTRIGAAGVWEQHFSYGNELSRVVESIVREAGAVRSTAYRYDERHRLVGVGFQEPNAQSIGFAYDAGDNLVGLKRTKSVGYGIQHGSNRRAGAARYQIDGSLSDDGDRHFDWDADGHLKSISQNGRLIAEYSYNALGERTRKTTFLDDRAIVTLYVYEQDKLIAETDDRGLVTKQYVWLDDQPVAMIDRDNVLGIVADQTYAPRALVDAHGKWVSQSAINLRGSGQYHDAESGLQYNGRRYLDPNTGRYLSVDPLGVAGGSNPYAFASNDRISNVDLLGLQSRPALTLDQNIGDWTFDQKLGYIFEEAAKQITDHELATALRELVSPQALATTAIIFSTWAASQFTPYGWVGDLALTGIGALFLGKSIWDVIETTFSVAKGMAIANCQSDLRNVSAILAHGLSQAAAALVAASSAGAVSGSARIARLLRTIFKRDVGSVKRSSSQAAINQSRFGIFNPSRGPYSGRAANREWMELQRSNGRSDAHPPWDPRRPVVDTWLNPGDKIYIVQDRSAGPGGWATPKQYRSLEEARSELSVLEEFKRSGNDLVLQEYIVTTSIPVREGFAGPQVSGWPASESYVGGGQQIQFLVDLRGSSWESYLTPATTIEIVK